MKIKKLLMFCLLICFMFGTTGCGDRLYELTDEESDIITIYAAKTVSKYNIRTGQGMCNAYVRDGELKFGNEVDNTTAQTPQNQDDVLNSLDQLLDELSGNNSSSSDSDNTVVQNPGSSDGGNNNSSAPATGTVTSGLALSDTLAVDGVDFTLSTFDVTDVYNAGSYFALTARNGYKYLVLNIKAKNKTTSPVAIDMLSRGSKYILTVNGSHKQASQTTILLNDLSTYKGTLGAGESKDMALLFMFPNDQLSTIDSVGFSVETNGTTRSTTLL